MGARCAVTGKTTSFGNNVSHSHRKTRRKWKINIRKRRVFDEESGRWTVLEVTSRGLRTIRKIGLKKALAKGAAK